MSIKTVSFSAEDLQAMSSEEAARILREVLSCESESTTEDYKAIKTLILKFPRLARRRVFHSRERETESLDFPLFALATKRIGSTWLEHMELLKLVYSAFPDAIAVLSGYGQLPLHTVCDKNLHPRIVMFFLKKWPQAAIQKDARADCSPLSYYVSCPTAHKAVVEALVKAAPNIIEFKYEMDTLTIENERDVEMHPLCIALTTNCAPEILELLIPTNPKSPCVKLELPYTFDSMVGMITPKKSELLVRRVSEWIKTLQFDTRWFTREGLTTFFSELADAEPEHLDVLDVHIASNVFGHSKVRKAFSKLLSKSPNLSGIRVRKPHDGTGPSNDDPFFSALAAGLDQDHHIVDLGLASVRGHTFSGLDTILSTCSRLTSIAFTLVSFTQEGLESFVRGIRQSRVLKSLILDDLNLPAGGMSQIMEALASSPSIEIVKIEVNQAGDIRALTQVTNVKHLVVETDPYKDLYNNGPTNSVLDLLEMSPNLVRLEVTQLHLPVTRLSEILKRNSVLNSLTIHGCRDANKVAKGIVRALRDSNGTLLHVQFDDEDWRLYRDLNEQLKYYTALNSMGRAKVMQVETANLSDLVTILVQLSAMSSHCDDAGDHVASVLRYGILRESPSLWSGEYTEGADEENSLSHAILGR